MRQEPVYMGMAAIPARISNLAQSLPGLLRQCDRLFLHINGAEPGVPLLPRELLDHPRLQLSATRENLGAAAKFRGVAQCPSGYFLSLDDDFIYPENYASCLVSQLEAVGGKALVSVYGATFDADLPAKGLYHRMVFRAPIESLAYAERVMLPGTGTMGMNLSEFRFTPEDCEFPNIDDFCVGFKAAREGIPVYLVARPDQWLVPLPDGNESLTRRLPMGLIEAAVAREQAALQKVWAAICGQRVGTPSPWVSVIVVVRDAPGALQRALNGLVAQDYPAIEVMVVNIGSRNLVSGLQPFGAKLTLSYWQGGPDEETALLNQMVLAARGEYVCCAKAEECFLPHHVSVLVTLLRCQPGLPAAYTAMADLPMRMTGQGLQSAGPPVKKWVAWEECQAGDVPDAIPLGTLMMSRQMVIEVGGLSPLESGVVQKRLGAIRPLRGFSRTTVERIVVVPVEEKLP